MTLPLSKGNVKVLKTEALVTAFEHVCHESVCALFGFFLVLNQAAMLQFEDISSTFPP